MRILQVLNNMGAGGAEQYVAQLCSYLVDNGDYVVVVASEPFSIKNRFSAEVKTIPMPLYPEYGAPKYSYYFQLIPNIYSIYRLIKREKIQLVHTHLAVSAVSAWFAAWLAGVPVIHSKMHTQIIAGGAERVLFASPLPKLLVDRFLAFSGYIAKEIRQIWRVSEKNIIHSSIAVNVDVYDPSHILKSAARAVFSLPENVLVVSVVARLTREKGVDLAVAGFSEMLDKSAILLVAGDGAQRAELEEMARVRGVHQRVRFLGQQADPRPIYAAADIVMQTTRGPNMGMIALESLSMGVPLLIATRDENEVEMANDTLGGYDVGLVVAADPLEIGKVLDVLSANKGLLDAKKIDARRYILNRHDERKILAELRESYRQLIEGDDL